MTGNEIYGNDGDLRCWLEEQQRPYVLAVARSRPVWQDGRQVRIDELIPRIPGEAWQRLEVGGGGKGLRPGLGRRPVALSDRGRTGAAAPRPPLAQ